MAKVLKNQTGSDIEMAETGVSVPASGQITIDPINYSYWATTEAISEITTHINSGDIVINDGTTDLTVANGYTLQNAIDFLKYPDFAENIRLKSSPEKANDFSSKTVQDGLEEIDFRSETREPTGFINPNVNQSLDSIATTSFDDGTKTFTITPVGGSYEYFIHGQKVEITTPLSIAIDDTNGVHIIYLNELGALTKYTGAGADKPYDGMEIKVGVVLWCVATQTHYWIGDARSELSMTWGTQRRTHFISGTEHSANSFEFENTTLNGDGSLDAHAQIGLEVGSGRIYHEDAEWTISHSVTPTARWEQYLNSIAKIPILYREGSGNGVWKKKAAVDWPIYNDGANTIFWNEDTGSSWQLTNVGDKQFVAMYIFATIDFEEPIVAVMGDHSENSPAQALHSHMRTPPGLPFPAMSFIGALIYQSSTGFTNTPHARLTTFTTIIDEVISTDRYAIITHYGGQANTGRYLEIWTGESSDSRPILIPEDSFIRTVTVQSSQNLASGDKVGFFEIGNLTTPRLELDMAPFAGTTEAIFDVSEFFIKGEEVVVQITAGSINKPTVRFWLETSP